MKTSLVALGMLLTLLTAGCAALGPQGLQSQRVDQMLARVLHVSSASPAIQRQALERAREAFAARHGEFERLRLATLLASLPAPLRNDDEAAGLLAPLTAHPPDTPVARFASMLALQVAEVRRRNEALQQSQDQAQKLQHKIDELEAIERRALDNDVHSN